MTKYALLLVFALLPELCAAALSSNKTGPAVWSAIDAAARAEAEDKQFPSLTLAVVGRDGIQWSQAYGFEDADKTRSATIDSIYRVGSLAQTLTALLAEDLERAGKLKLDQPVQSYLRDFRPVNPFGGAVTVRMLMTHTAGLVREAPVGSYWSSSEPALAATVLSLNKTALVAKPGTVTKFSNAGVAVLARTLEVVTGQSYHELIRAKWLEPLGMRASTVDRKSLASAPVYAEMVPFDSTRFPAPVFDIGETPAGGLYASVRDLAQIARKLISQQMPLESEGHVYGFSSSIVVAPDQDLAVIAVGALDGSPSPARLTHYAMSVLAQARSAQPLAAWPRSSAFDSNAGALQGFFHHGGDSLVLRRVADKLYLEAPTVASEVRRASDGQGQVLDDAGTFESQFRISADHNQVLLSGVTYERAVPQEPPPPAAPLAEIVGDYGWPHSYIRIYERDGHPYARIDWSSYQQLTPAGKNVWAFPHTGPYAFETIRFERDARGKIQAAHLSGVSFPRRDFGAEAETALRSSMRPLANLRAEARAATPPVEKGSKRPVDLVEITSAMPGIRLDVRYATTNNFVKAPVYTEARAFMQRPAVDALRRVASSLASRGFGLTIHDAYRPWFVTKMFWDATPAYNHIFVADPAQGSRHNRGCAVDLTLHELRSGRIVQMPGGYDEMSSRSFPLYVGGTSQQRWRRDLLRDAMEAQGFRVYEAEWWHFDFEGWADFPVSNLEFSDIDRR